MQGSQSIFKHNLFYSSLPLLLTVRARSWKLQQCISLEHECSLWLYLVSTLLKCIYTVNKCVHIVYAQLWKFTGINFPALCRSSSSQKSIFKKNIKRRELPCSSSYSFTSQVRERISVVSERTLFIFIQLHLAGYRKNICSFRTYSLLLSFFPLSQISSLWICYV
jgi:hypothetical protein